MEIDRETLSSGMGSPPSPRPPDPFKILVRAYTRLVRLAAWQMGAPEADLGDITQEVFLRLHLAMKGGLDVAGPLDGWLLRVTYTVTRDRRKLARHAREQVTATGEIETADRAPDPEATMIKDQMHRLVNEVLDELPTPQRDVLVMSEMGEMSMPEIAEALGINVDTGYSRLRAARAVFGTKLRQRQATQSAAVLPFALWTALDLLAATRVPPPSPPGFDDAVVARVTAAIAAGLGGAVPAAVGAAVGVKAGLTLTAAQIMAGVVVSFVAGAALHAGLARTPGTVAAPVLPAIVAAPDARNATGGPPTASAAATVVQVTATASDEGRRTGTAPPGDDARRTPAAGQGSEADERRLLLAARGAIERGDPQGALALLARLKSPRLAVERDELRRLARAAQDGGR